MTELVVFVDGDHDDVRAGEEGEERREGVN